MHALSDQIKEAYETDLAYYTLLQNNAAEFHEEMAEVDPGYLKSFEASQRDRITQRDKLFQAEQQWAASTFVLYDYAAKNAKEIIINRDDFHFANDRVRSEFNRPLEQSKSLFNNYQTAFQEAQVDSPEVLVCSASRTCTGPVRGVKPVLGIGLDSD